MILHTVLPGVVDHPGLVHLHLRGGPPAVRRVPHAPPDGVVVEAEVVLAAVDRHRARASLVRAVAARVHVGSANYPRWAECLGLVTVGVSF